MQRKEQGFTLIELMITIAVLAIIATMAAPSFTQTIRKNQLTSDTRDFVNLLAETRSEAIFKQGERILAVDNSVSTFYKKWIPNHVTKQSGDASVTFNRLGQSTITGNGQCFIFKHNSDAALKSYVYVQKGGTVIYNKMATSCPT
ncbi:MAG: pilus assembly FimT family protein [Acinetobacter sp.]